jgi:hypothetical protein
MSMCYDDRRWDLQELGIILICGIQTSKEEGECEFVTRDELLDQVDMFVFLGLIWSAPL